MNDFKKFTKSREQRKKQNKERNDHRAYMDFMEDNDILRIPLIESEEMLKKLNDTVIYTICPFTKMLCNEYVCTECTTTVPNGDITVYEAYQLMNSENFYYDKSILSE